jgi:lysophospholipase L1-like esterase
MLPLLGMKRRLARVGLVTLSAVASLFICELALRALVPSDWLRSHYKAWLVRDPVMGWMNKPGFRNRSFEINSLGLRGPEVVLPKPAGTLRIVCLGDSGTFGVWNAEAPKGQGGYEARFESYPEELAKRLRDTGWTGVEVLNAGVLGYSTSHGLRQLGAFVLDLDPDILVVRFGHNEYRAASAPALRAEGPTGTLARNALEGFRQWRLLALGMRAHQAVAWLHPEPGSVPWVSPERFQLNLRRFIEIAQVRNLHLLMVDYPLRPLEWGEPRTSESICKAAGVGSLRELYDVHERYQQLLRRIVREERAPLLETRRRFEQRHDPVFSEVDPVHPNSTGARELARLVAERLEALGWLAAPASGPARE